MPAGKSYKPEELVFLDEGSNTGYAAEDLVFLDEQKESTLKETAKAVPRGFWKAREMLARAGRIIGVPDDAAVEHFKEKAKGWESEDPGTFAQGVEA
ncbi:MAG TPA: hypothetical protein PK183_09545, partial [Bacillota bacterium]|nr:hypothetical protein [Bacillota bacterium]